MRIRVKFQPKGKVISVFNGENLLQAALKNRVYIKNRCGGKGSCTACKVQILTKNSILSPLSSQELRLIRDEDLIEGYRLACQTRIFGPAEVAVPEDSWKTTVNRQLEALNNEKRKEE